MKTSRHSSATSHLRGLRLALGMAVLTALPAMGQLPPTIIGKDWTWKSPVSATAGSSGETLNAVAARAAISGRFDNLCVVVGNNGVAASSVVGTDTWIPRVADASPSPANLNAMAYAVWSGLPGSPGPTPPVNHPEYETFVAVGENGTITTTKDGVTWTLVDNPVGANNRTENLIRLVWSGGTGIAGQFLAVSSGSNPVIYTSTDAATWVKKSMGPSLPVRDLIWCDPSGTANDMYVALFDTGYLVSASGTTWASTPVAFPADVTSYIDSFTAAHTFQPTAITWNASRNFTLVGTSSGYRAIMNLPLANITSGGLGAWEDKTPTDLIFRAPSRVFSLAIPGGSADAMIMFDEDPTHRGAMSVGTSAGVWNFLPSPADVGWKGAARLPGGVAIIVGEGGRIMTTPDSTPNNFTNRYATGGVEDITTAVWTAAMVVVSTDGKIQRSTDGTYWTAVTSPTTNALHDVVYTGTQFVAVGDAGTILTSSDGRAWTMQTSGAGTDILTSIAWSGSALVAVGGTLGGGVGEGRTYRSINGGITWTPQNPGADPITKITWTGSRFIGLDGSAFVTSNDGSSWQRTAYPDSLMFILTGHITPYSPTENALLKSIVWDGSRYVVVGNKIAVATDYVPTSTWTDTTPAGFTGLLTQVVRTGRSNLENPLGSEVVALDSSPVGSLIRTTATNNAASATTEVTGASSQLRSVLRIGIRTIAVGDGGTIMTRDDGVATWAVRASATTSSIQAIASNGQLPDGGTFDAKLFAFGGEVVTTSPQGNIWSPLTPITGLEGPITSIVWTGANYFAVNSKDNGSIYTSNNGSAWTSVSPPLNADQFYRIHHTGSQFIAVGDDDEAHSIIQTSPTGALGTWTARTVSGTVRLQAIASSPSIIVVGGLGGKLFTSATGVSWAAATSTTTSPIKDIEWNGSVFVAVSANGDIQTSTNGTSWVKRQSLAGSGLNTVVWTGAQFVAMGNKGTNFASYNGQLWRDNTINTDANFNEVVWMGSRLVAFGDRGVIMISEGVEPVQPALTFTSASSTVNENAVTAQVTINLLPASPLPQVMNLTLTGTAGVADYAKTTVLPLTFAANETTKTISFTIKEDLLDEHTLPTRPDETIILNFSGLSGEAKVGAIATHTINITDNDQVPTFTAHPQHQLVATGSTTAPFGYTELGGTGTILTKWRKNAIAIPGQTGPTLTLANVKLTDAVTYDVQLSNNVVGGVKDSLDAYLGVVDATPKTVVVLEGVATTAFTQLAAGKEIATFQFRWKRGTSPTGVLVTADATHLTPTTKTFTIKNATAAADEGLYYCDVSDTHGHTVSGGAINLYVVSAIPVISPVSNLTRFVSEPIDFTPSATHHPTRWTVSGLPPGIKANLATGRIYGHPTTVSKVGVPYKVKFTAFNPKGSSATAPTLPVEMQITVNALPVGIAGTYMAKVLPELEANNDTGGRIEFTITPNGAYTGKAYLAAGIHPFTGAIDTAASGTIHTSNTTVPRVGKTALPLAFTLDTNVTNSEITTGSIGAATIPIGWRYSWTVGAPATAYTSLLNYTFGMMLKSADAAVQANPKGDGFGSFKVATTGKLTAAFTMADGAAVTQASFVNGAGRIFVFAPLYKGTGSVRDELVINSSTHYITGNPVWIKKAQLPATVDLKYKSGIGPLTLDAMGGLYTPVGVAPAIIMGLNATAANLNLDFTEGGPSTGTPAPVSIHLTPTVTAPAKVAPITPTTNLPTLIFTTTTGKFTGSFTLSDTDVFRPGKFVTRKVSYFGQLYDNGSGQLVGTGYFMLPELPASLLETTAKTKQNSGLVEATKVP